MQRWHDILARTLAATGGGWLLTYSATAALAVSLPVDCPSAVLTASITSFVIYTGAVLWAFAARSSVRVWWTMGLVAAPLAVVGFASPLPLCLR
jgi:hypothetical protein